MLICFCIFFRFFFMSGWVFSVISLAICCFCIVICVDCFSALCVTTRPRCRAPDADRPHRGRGPRLSAPLRRQWATTSIGTRNLPPRRSPQLFHLHCGSRAHGGGAMCGGPPHSHEARTNARVVLSETSRRSHRDYTQPDRLPLSRGSVTTCSCRSCTTRATAFKKWRSICARERSVWIPPPQVRLFGKGRKERICSLWRRRRI